MTGDSALWIWVAIIGAIIGCYYLYKQGKIPWLKGIVRSMKMPRMFEPKEETQIERLKAATEKEVARAEELRSVLEAKTDLAKARAISAKLQKQIDGVSEKSVEKDKKAEKDAQEAQKVRPRRL